MGKTGLRNFATTLVAVLLWGAGGEGAEAAPQPPSSQARAPTKRVARARTKPEMSANWQARHGLYYRRNWGVEIVGVRRISSGLMLRFDYRVLDPTMAVSLNDKNARPYLIDETTNTALS